MQSKLKGKARKAKVKKEDHTDDTKDDTVNIQKYLARKKQKAMDAVKQKEMEVGPKETVFKKVEKFFAKVGLIKLISEDEKPLHSSVYDFNVITAEGQNLSLREYEGKVMLITNTGRLDKHASQAKQLELLYKKYRDKGLVVLGFFNNEFNNEPGT